MDYKLQDEKNDENVVINFKHKGFPKLQSDFKDKLPQKEDWATLEFLENENITMSKTKNKNIN